MSALDIPASIAGTVHLMRVSQAIACPDRVGRKEAGRHLIFRPAAREDRGPADALVGMVWWNGLTLAERAYWLDVVGTAVPADGWRAFQAGTRPP